MTITDVKQIRISDYLHSLGYNPVKQQGGNLWYKSPFRQESEPSFKVNTELNLWYDFGAGKGGNIIALAQELYASDDLRCLLEKIAEQAPHVRPVSFSFGQQSSSQPSFQQLEVRDLVHPALLRYLQGRGINIELAKRECKELHFTHNGKPYFAIGFPNVDWRLRGAQLLFQRLHRTERHHPHTATGRAEGEMFGVRGRDGLSFVPHAAHEELPDHA